MYKYSQFYKFSLNRKSSRCSDVIFMLYKGGCNDIIRKHKYNQPDQALASDHVILTLTQSLISEAWNARANFTLGTSISTFTSIIPY